LKDMGAIETPFNGDDPLEKANLGRVMVEVFSPRVSRVF
jgi:hypothetical protein